MAAAQRFVIETRRPFRESAIWQLQRAYFAARGVGAWRHGEVPHYVTSNPTIANSYAEIVLAFWRDRQRLAPDVGDEPLTICELGAGAGRFAFYFLRRLEILCGLSAVSPRAFRYVLSDAAEANLDFWRSHPGFEPFFSDGRLDLARLDVAKPEGLALEMSGDTIDSGDLRQPLVVVANYVFDGIPQDLFKFEDSRAYACMVSSELAEDPATLDPAALLARLQIRYDYQELAESPYAEPWLRQLFAEYQHGLRATHLLLPVAGLHCLQRIAEFSSSGLLVLSADKGVHRLDALEGRKPPVFTRHGSVSLPVNYHAFTRFCTQAGGLALAPAPAHTSVDVMGFLMLADAERHQETQRAYRLHVQDFGPDDFFSITTHARKTVAQMSAREILAFVRLSRHDSHQFGRYLPRLMELAPEMDSTDRQALIEAVENVWDMYFPLGEDFDLANGIAGLLFVMNDHEGALVFYEHSMAIYGPDTGTLCNIAACYHRLGERARAAAVLHKVLEYDPDSAMARGLLTKCEEPPESDPSAASHS